MIVEAHTQSSHRRLAEIVSGRRISIMGYQRKPSFFLKRHEHFLRWTTMESNEPLDAPAANEVHPVLQRHYSTIGIGEVFVKAPNGAGWLLPSSYLAASYTPAVATTVAQQQPLWEMIGTIKSTPEDFCVREMAILFGGDMQVADLSLASEPQKDEFVRAVVPDAKEEQPNDTTSLQDTIVGTTAAIDVATWSKDDGCASRNHEEYYDPLERLKCVLERQLRVGNDASQQSPVEALVALQNLEAVALDSIQQLATAAAAPSSSLSASAVSFSLAMPSTDPQQQKKERGKIYDAIRHAFPLLKAEAATEASDDGYCHIRVTIDDYFFDLVPSMFAPVEDLPPLYEFFKRGFEYAQRQTKKDAVNIQQDGRGSGQWHRHGSRGRRSTHGPILRLKPDLPRSDRRPVHQIIDSKSKGMLGTETLNDFPLQPDNEADTTTAIVVHWTNVAARRMARKRTRDESNDCATTSPRNEYMLCVVRKRQREHLAMINTLSAGLRCRPADIGLAGIKDMHAVTYQFCTLSYVASKRICVSSDYLKQRGVEIVPLHKVDRALGKGDLVGNRFDIVVRNLRRAQLLYANNTAHEAFVPVDESHLKQMVDRIRTGGFVNFYGEQRVGDPGHESLVGVRAFDIGRAMLKQDFSKAIDLLLTGRRIVKGVEMEGDDVDLFRRTWKESGGDPLATTKNLPPGGSSVPRERMVLKGLTRYGKDNPLAALRCLQRSDRLFFINAVRKPKGQIPPNKAFRDPSKSSLKAHATIFFPFSQYQSYIWNMMATERLRRYGNKVVPGDLLLAEGGDFPELATEHSLNEAIEKVVLPMPGYDVRYPQNEIGQLYQDLLTRENVRFDKSAPEESKAKGAYRRLITSVSNLTYELLPLEGDSVNVKFSFELPKGSYATMLLRELMLKTVARDSSEYF
jgi:TruD family tRNA pseudouridine synthase